MNRTITAITAAALFAGLVTIAPAFIPEVEASTPAALTKSDRLDARPLGTACSQRGWPYFEANCLRDRTRPSGQIAPARVISTDRMTPA